MSVSIEIDEGSGFCFGVVNAIRKAEDALKSGKSLYCLGDIVHNNMEVSRLEKLGLRTINLEQFKTLKDETVLLRAHGEPPQTYSSAKENNIELIDATCPVVLQLQRSVYAAYLKSKADNGQVVIYGKIGHAEVNGLVGQTNGEAIVIESLQDIVKVDLSRSVYLFSQTTMMVDRFLEIKKTFEDKIASGITLEVHNTVCRRVSGRINALQEFSRRNDIIIFVSGRKSSNGKALYNECKKVNKHSYMVANETEVVQDWLVGCDKIGICGATSTPDWLMQKVADYVRVLSI